MPNRILKESIRSSPNLAALSDAGERLFSRLITSVDDFGRFDGDPEVILSACFQRKPKGWTVAKVSAGLQELAAAPAGGDKPLIRLYQVEGRPYIEFVKAELHISRRAEKSRYPAPSEENIVPHAVASNCEQPQTNAPLNVFVFDNVSESGHLARPPRAKAASELPEGWAFNERHAELAKGLGLNVHAEAAKFRDHCKAKGTTFKDWDAAFRSWLNKAKEFAR